METLKLGTTRPAFDTRTMTTSRSTQLRPAELAPLDSVALGQDDAGIYNPKMFEKNPASRPQSAFQAASAKIPGLTRQSWTNYSALGSAGSGLKLGEIDGLLADSSLDRQQRELLQLDRMNRFGSAEAGSATPLNAAQKAQALATLNGSIWETVVEMAKSIHNQVTKIIGSIGAIARNAGGKRGGILAGLASGLNSFSYGIQALWERDMTKAIKSFGNGLSSVKDALVEVMKRTPKGSWVKWVPGVSAVSDGIDTYTYAKKSTDAQKRGDEFGGACYGIAACLYSLSGVMNLASPLPGAGVAISSLAKGTGAIAAGVVVLAEMVD